MQQPAMRAEAERDRYLLIYIQDHLAGSVALAQLIARCRGNNRSDAMAGYLRILQQELLEDRAVLKMLLGRLGGREDRIKNTGAWLLEKAGRLKLNGHWLAYSALSRLEELEAISLGLAGKQAFWEALADLAPVDHRFDGIDFPGLCERVREQRKRIEDFHLEAAARAFRPDPTGTQEGG